MEDEQNPTKLIDTKPTRAKKTLGLVFYLMCLVLLVLPFWVSFQDLLTRGVMSVGWYKSIQDAIVPYQLKIVGGTLSLMGLPIRVGQAYVEWNKAGGGTEVVYLIWNCVGWQSMVLFLITLTTGFSGRHTLWSKVEALVFGLLGTYLVNILRLVTVVLVYYWTGRSAGIVFHDYFSNMFTFVWLIFYWKIIFSFVFEAEN
jgi:exosortase/archaeosortase family protein